MQYVVILNRFGGGGGFKEYLATLVHTMFTFLYKSIVRNCIISNDDENSGFINKQSYVYMHLTIRIYYMYVCMYTYVCG